MREKLRLPVSDYVLDASKITLVLALAGLTLMMQTGDHPAPIAKEFSEKDIVAGQQATKTDRWQSPQQESLHAIRLAHLWDGTPDSMLANMVAPKADHTMLAYAHQTTMTDASRALQRFDQGIDIAETAPRPLSRPRNLGMNVLTRAPLSLLATMPQQPTFQQSQPNPGAPTTVKVAAIGPAAMPEMQHPAPTHPEVTPTAVLNLPYTLQTPAVRTGCFPQQLVSLIDAIEEKYKKKVVVTSGARDRGRRGSLHRHCAAADIIVPGVSGAELASFAKTIPGVGGVGRYCHPYLVHIDIGRSRDWAFGCQKIAGKS